MRPFRCRSTCCGSRQGLHTRLRWTFSSCRTSDAARVEPRLTQWRFPSITRLGRNQPMHALRRCGGENLSLEFEHRRLIDLENGRTRRPRKPMGTGIEPGRQDPDLPHAVVHRLAQSIVDELAANSEEVGQGTPAAFRPVRAWSGRQAATRIRRATRRSAYGSLISASSRCVSTARPAVATMAVAPTSVVTSHPFGRRFIQLHRFHRATSACGMSNRLCCPVRGLLRRARSRRVPGESHRRRFWSWWWCARWIHEMLKLTSAYDRHCSSRNTAGQLGVHCPG